MSKQLTGLPLVTFFLLMTILSSCKKDFQKTSSKPDIAEETKTKSNLRNREGCSNIKCNILRWLEDQKQGITENGVEIIDRLSLNLDFQSISYEDLRFQSLQDDPLLEPLSDERIVIIPINHTFQTNNNSEYQHHDKLLIILDENGEISSGKIVQFVNSGEEVDAPNNTFHKFYNGASIEWDGTMTFLTVTDMFLEEYVFFAGNLTKHRGVEPRDENGVVSFGNRVQCLPWFLITTTHYSDGGTDTWEEYLGTTCSGHCGPSDIGSMGCDNPGDQGGGGNPDEMLDQIFSWEVFDIDYLFGHSGNWHIKATVKVKAKGVRGGSGLFNSADVVGLPILTCSDPWYALEDIHQYAKIIQVM